MVNVLSTWIKTQFANSLSDNRSLKIRILEDILEEYSAHYNPIKVAESFPSGTVYGNTFQYQDIFVGESHYFVGGWDAKKLIEVPSKPGRILKYLLDKVSGQAFYFSRKDINAALFTKDNTSVLSTVIKAINMSNAFRITSHPDERYSISPPILDISQDNIHEIVHAYAKKTRQSAKESLLLESILNVSLSVVLPGTRIEYEGDFFMIYSSRTQNPYRAFIKLGSKHTFPISKYIKTLALAINPEKFFPEHNGTIITNPFEIHDLMNVYGQTRTESRHNIEQIETLLEKSDYLRLERNNGFNKIIRIRD